MVGPVGPRERVVAAEAELFKALAHPARVRVLAVLTEGPASVADLCSATGLKPSHLAGQLAQLRAQHLVTGRRSGGRLEYCLSFPEIADLLSAAGSLLNARAAADIGAIADPRAGRAGPGSAGEGILTDESAAIPEESLERRTLIARAVHSIGVRTGRSSDDALAGLLAEARERSLTVAEVSRETVPANGQE